MTYFVGAYLRELGLLNGNFRQFWGAVFLHESLFTLIRLLSIQDRQLTDFTIIATEHKGARIDRRLRRLHKDRVGQW